MIIANVIFPAFTAPYVSVLVFPVAGVAAITTEAYVFYRLNTYLTVGESLKLVLVANIVSGLIGFILAALLPSGLVSQATESGQSILTQGPRWGLFAILGYCLAFALSIGIEGLVLKSYGKSIALLHIWRTVAWANTASYAALIGVYLLFAIIVW